MNTDIINLTLSENGQPVVSSRDIAERFEKQHKHVLETIQNLTAENSALLEMFHLSEYTTVQNKKLPMYYMNRDGFSLLAMGFTGSKALEWKLKYIEAFNKMEQELHNKPLTMPEYLLAQAQMMVEQEKKIRQLTELGERNTEAIRSIGSALNVPTIDRDQWQQDMNSFISKLSLDYSIPHQTAYGDLYGALEDKTGCDLEARQRNMRRRLEQQGAPYKERQKITKLSAIAVDSNLRTTFEALVQKYAAHLAAKKWGQ